MARNDTDLSVLKGLLDGQRRAQIAEGAPDAEMRIDRLDRSIALLKENSSAFEEALNADFGNRSFHASALTDIMTPVGALKYARKNVRKWMRPEKRPVEPWLLGLLGAKAFVQFQPKGVIGIVSPWNFPVGLIFSPLAAAFAAGNRAIVKPSEYTPRTSELIQKLIQKRFDPRELAVVTGGPDVGAAFTSLPFDHLIFTGAGTIASHVLHAAADNLVPVTLELGGKSPVVIGQGADMAVTGARVMAGKVLNAGQICLAPDYVYVPEDQRDAFVSAATAATKKMLPTVRDNADYTSIISEKHFDRLKSYIADAKSKGAKIVEINPSNERFDQQEHRKIPPTLILDATLEMEVMQEEVFGPLLPVMTYHSLEEVLSGVNSMDRPLALYYFGSHSGELAELERRTTSGGVCVNDVIMHCSQETLPFGGIGPSGMGAYHGRDGFLEFSHKKAVYHQIKRDLGPLITLRPPYDNAVRKLIRSTIGG